MESELLTSQITAAYITASILQWLKLKPWFPFVQENMASLNRAFAAMVAFIASIGIHYTFDAELGVLTITGLTTATILHGSWAAIQQFAMQQFMYKGVIKPQVTVAE